MRKSAKASGSSNEVNFAKGRADFRFRGSLTPLTDPGEGWNQNAQVGCFSYEDLTRPKQQFDSQLISRREPPLLAVPPSPL